jgi:hypothetical protein
MSKPLSIPILKQEVVHHPFKHERQLKVLGHWMGALLPTTVVIASGLLFFRAAVFSSIASTPHPELVYAILGTFLLGCVLTCFTLYRYTIEGNLIHQWSHVKNSQRGRLLDTLQWNSYLVPLFEIMLGQRQLSPGSRQAVVEQEIVAVNDRFNDRLSLPNYLAGALIGLGLVGTFVGLLGTLEDLGKLFGALVQTGSASANPVDVFSDMVRRLQDPMRGMGTAFVASLYGLLGSLILGLQILAVSKIGRGLIHQLHVLVRRTDIPDAEVSLPRTATHAGDQVLLRTDGKQVQFLSELNDAWRAQQDLQQKQTDALRHELLAVTKGSQVVTEKILDHLTTASNASLAEQTKRWQEMSEMFRTHLEQTHSETQLLRREIFNVIQTCQSIAIAVRTSMSAEEKFRQTVPQTTYWQDAWSKVQAYLQKSNTEQTLVELSRISTQQTQLMADISTTLKAMHTERVRH